MKKIIILSCLFGFLNSFSQITGVEDPSYGSFSPFPGKKYIVSCWVKEIHDNQLISYEQSNISINFLLNYAAYGTTYIFYPSGDIIDGWQRILGIIEIPASPTTTNQSFLAIEVKLNNASEVVCYFDDVRYFPYNGTMKSFVYDENSKKLMAELDENNYATFYEYDQEGGLVRVKKETEKGVFTIQETRSSTKKNEED